MLRVKVSQPAMKLTILIASAMNAVLAIHNNLVFMFGIFDVIKKQPNLTTKLAKYIVIQHFQNKTVI